MSTTQESLRAPPGAKKSEDDQHLQNLSETRAKFIKTTHSLALARVDFLPLDTYEDNVRKFYSLLKNTAERITDFSKLYEETLREMHTGPSPARYVLGPELIDQVRKASIKFEGILDLLEIPRADAEVALSEMGKDFNARGGKSSPPGNRIQMGDQQLRAFSDATEEFQRIYTEKFRIPELLATVREFSESIGTAPIKPRGSG